MRVRDRVHGEAQADVLARFGYRIKGELFEFSVTRVGDCPVVVTLNCTGARFCWIEPAALLEQGPQRAGFMAVRQLMATMDERSVWQLIKEYPKWHC